MKQLTQIIQEFKGEYYKNLLRNIYIDNSVALHQKSRYIKALECFRNHYGEQLVALMPTSPAMFLLVLDYLRLQHLKF